MNNRRNFLKMLGVGVAIATPLGALAVKRRDEASQEPADAALDTPMEFMEFMETLTLEDYRSDWRPYARGARHLIAGDLLKVKFVNSIGKVTHFTYNIKAPTTTIGCCVYGAVVRDGGGVRLLSNSEATLVEMEVVDAPV
jgi:hypothetical protein